MFARLDSQTLEGAFLAFFNQGNAVARDPVCAKNVFLVECSSVAVVRSSAPYVMLSSYIRAFSQPFSLGKRSWQSYS